MPRPLRPHTVLSHGAASYQFFNADCVDLFEHWPGPPADVVVTSPPYNLGITYNTFQDTMPRPEYLSWTSNWIAALSGVLAPDASVFLNVGSKPTDPWLAMDVAQAARSHLHLQNTFHWVKSIAIERTLAGSRSGLTDDLAVGHYKPINSRRFVHDCHEFIFHFTPAGQTPLDRQAVGIRYQDQSNVSRWQHAGSGMRCRGNTWFIPYETIQDRDKDRPHPATFPTRLPEMCVRLHGVDRTRVVVDPFLGLGSTAVACARLGVSFVGVELDEAYLLEAVERTKAALSEHRSS